MDTLVSEKYKNMAQFTKVLEDDVIEQPNLKWRVDKVGDRGQVTLQSVQLNEYLCRDSEPSHFFLALELSSYPQDNERMIFYIADVGNGLYHFTNLYKDLIPLSFEFFISESSSDIKGKFSFGNPENYMIYIPPKSDSLYAIASFENPGASGITFEYETVIGIVNTMPGAKKISASVEVSIGLEIRGAFSYGMKYSQTWNTSSCEIYSKATTTVVTITVPPHKVAWVMQVVGTYGHYSVYSNDIKVVNKNPSGVLRMEEFNRGELLPESYIIGELTATVKVQWRAKGLWTAG